MADAAPERSRWKSLDAGDAQIGEADGVIYLTRRNA